jgi:Raf kinase inhibitor-like YbhB/YbcL family protein
MKPEVSKIDRGPSLKRVYPFAIVLFSCVLVSVLCWQRSEPVHGKAGASFWVHSSSFSNGKSIPGRYTCDGANLSPQLRWQPAPAGTKSLAIVMEDPDAPIDFTHWLVYNIPPGVRELGEGASQQGAMPQGSVEGRNDFGRPGYGGPCPPRGNPHHYLLRVYALDIRLDLSAGATRKQVDAAMSGHVVAQGQIVGAYQRMTP